MSKFLINAKFLLFFLLIVAVFSCKNDDDIPTPPTADLTIASFQYEVSDTNPLTVVFNNFSQNATSYSWAFGDSQTSTEESPTHTYGSGGTFTVELSATGADGIAVKKTEVISLTDPNSALTLLAGSGSKTWYLQREGIALGIGIAPGDNVHWSFGGVTPLKDRPCILDDSFTFKTDGTFEFSSNGTIFIDSEDNGGWLGPNGAEGCYDEDDAILTSANGDDLTSFGDGGAYTYEYDPTANSLVLNGEGVFIGLANKTSAGDNFIPEQSKRYTVFNFVDGPVADSLQIAIILDDGNAWNFYLVSYDDINDLPAIPGGVAPSVFTPDVLSSATGKVWKLDGSGSYAVGPTAGSSEYWFIGLNPADLTARACQFDDEWIFFDDGTMEYDSKGVLFGEAYMGVDPSACVDDAALTAPYDVFASGSHMFSATETQITAIGSGAYIGFNKAYNGAELDGVTAPASQIVYEVLEYTKDGGKETVTFAVDYTDGFWTMRIFSEN